MSYKTTDKKWVHARNFLQNTNTMSTIQMKSNEVIDSRNVVESVYQNKDQNKEQLTVSRGSLTPLNNHMEPKHPKNFKTIASSPNSPETPNEQHTDNDL